MSVSTAQTDRRWSQFRALPRESRNAFLLRSVGDPAIRKGLEDLPDLEIAMERASEPARPLREINSDAVR